MYLSENVKISIEFRISGCKETELVSRRQQKDKAIKKKRNEEQAKSKLVTQAILLKKDYYKNGELKPSSIQSKTRGNPQNKGSVQTLNAGRQEV